MKNLFVMLKRKKVWVPMAIGTGVVAFTTGALISTQVKPGQNTADRMIQSVTQAASSGQNGGRVGAPSAVMSPLTQQAPKQRAAALQQTAQAAQPSLDRNRARYVLANDQIAAGQGSDALKTLDKLEADYPVLGAAILAKRAQAYELAKQPDRAAATWKAMVQQYPQDAASAEALFVLGKQTPQDARYWDQMLAQFPAHPRSLEIARARLQKNPNSLPLLLLLTRYDVSSKDATGWPDRLTQTFAAQLKPEDWQAVAFNYWENQKYDKAADAYARSPQTALTAYRAARGLHLSTKPGSKERYQQVVQAFPATYEAGLALTRLAQLAEPKEALVYLDQVIGRYPDRIPQALLDKSKVLEQLNSAQSATQLRQYLIDKYSDSEPAAKLRWQIAQSSAKTNDLSTAHQWADAILQANPKSGLGAKAGFWAGKWALQQGKQQDAQASFQKVIQQHPESYYAWRSAGMLGWPVGDFNSVRQMTPTINKVQPVAELPAGSATVKELHQIGQHRDAWAYWQVEHQNRLQPTVAEQFTDGLMRLGVGDNLDGLFMLSFLNEREKPEEKAQVAALQQQTSYWQALYPFPFGDQIQNWSQQRQLNPLLVTALIRQESRFEAGIHSSVGATGLMQVMPETADFIASQIKLKTFKLDNPEDNIKLGTWYLDHTHAEYSGNSMLAVASYNAGPGAVGDWVAKSKTQDVDEFVETIPYDETQGYVKSVFENYWNYLRLYNPETSQRVAQVSPSQPKPAQF